jgi:hypothetical protein
MISSPNERPAPELTADITLYPSEQGGRLSSILGKWYGCPCKVTKESYEGWDCRVLLDGNSLAPGETTRFGMIFLSAEKAVRLFRTAKRFYLCEGRII